jgi:hypothetical protein
MKTNAARDARPPVNVGECFLRGLFPTFASGDLDIEHRYHRAARTRDGSPAESAGLEPRR